MIFDRIGKAYLSSNEDGGRAPDAETTEETVIKIGEKEFTQVEFQTLLDSDAAGNIKVDVGDGKTATLKTLREAARREPDVQTLLKTEREKLEQERVAWKEEQKTEREKLMKDASEASTAQLTKFANALQEATGNGRKQVPFTTRDEAIAYFQKTLTEDRDGVGALTTLFDRFEELKTKTEAQLKEFIDKQTAENAKLRQEREDAEVDSFMRAEVKSVQSVFPKYDPEGDDEFSVLVTRLMTKKTPSSILDNKVGQKMDALDVAKMVEAHLEKGADARVAAKAEAKRIKEQSDVREVHDRGSNAALDDDLQKELNAAGADLDKINAVLQKQSARRRK